MGKAVHSTRCVNARRSFAGVEPGRRSDGPVFSRAGAAPLRRKLTVTDLCQRSGRVTGFIPTNTTHSTCDAVDSKQRLYSFNALLTKGRLGRAAHVATLWLLTLSSGAVFDTRQLTADKCGALSNDGLLSLRQR